MIIRLLITIALLSVLTGPVRAENRTLTDQASVDQRIRDFMEQANAGHVEQAYNALRPFLGVSVDAYNQSARDAADYFQKVFARAGIPLAPSQVRRQAISADFYRTTWLQKFPAAAIAWRFTFYQPDTGWKLVGISYSTELDDLYRTLDRSPD